MRMQTISRWVLVVTALGGCATGRATSAATEGTQQAKEVDGRQAEPPAWKPFLWRIEGTHSSYLFGVQHVLDERFATLPDIVLVALKSSENFYDEHIRSASDAAETEDYAVLPGSQTLEDILPDDVLVRLRRASERHRIRWDGLRRSRIHFAALFLSTLWAPRVRLADAVRLEDNLLRIAVSSGKPVESLESVNEGLPDVKQMSDDQQLRLLERCLDADEGRIPRTFMQFSSSDFASGDEAVALRAVTSDDPDEQAFLDALIVRRNERMTKRIIDRLADGKSSFFAIGVGHLVGPDGVVARLRRAGKTVTRVQQ